ncbi:MAG: hypothetical protein BroJett018_06250 [Chloroflexota bacterium]|nr:hypothetical protein [Chloroflexota bacterium]NOG63021.1 hypothetical protein [Chloroflexota bacterium]GIK62831.1 MAG: hypothetical protein BroJett018_06250 [Chloroflexota bacterium]
MQPFRKDDISRHEWRWVAIFAGILVTLALLPYAWASIASDNKWQFLGVLSNPQDGATYFSKIRQGLDGYWLFELMHTPEVHDRAGLFTFYLLLGQIARIVGLSIVVVFHLARVATSIFMFSALYQLGAVIWKRLRPRRLFFIFLALASGLGWVVLFFDDKALAPDLNVPEAFPFYAALVNPHFPLSIGLLALLAGIFLQVFRPGYNEAPSVENGGLAAILYSIILAIVQPPALVSFGGALVLLILITAYKRRDIPWHEVRWSSMVLLPTFPFALYYLLVFDFNETMGKFNEQNITRSPNVFLTLMAFGLLLLVATPAIVRAVRLFERDGDQLMLLWLTVNIILVYMPFNLQRRLFIGLIIPLVYFCIRAIEDYWMTHIPVKRQRLALILLFVFLIPSNFIVLFIPLFGAVSNREAGADAGILIEKNYVDVFDWLEINAREDEVVLGSPDIGMWIPAQASVRVVYGHPYETVPAKLRERQVKDFFEGKDCDTLFSDAVDFNIHYVVWGPREEEMGLLDKKTETIRPGVEECRQKIEDRATLTEQFGDVTLYVLREPR